MIRFVAMSQFWRNENCYKDIYVRVPHAAKPVLQFRGFAQTDPVQPNYALQNENTLFSTAEGAHCSYIPHGGALPGYGSMFFSWPVGTLRSRTAPGDVKVHPLGDLMYRVGMPFWKAAARHGVSVRLRVRIFRDEEAGVYFATSPDLDGLAVEAATLDELRSEALAATEILLEHALSVPNPKATTVFSFTDGTHCLA